jgi:CubicO group peptidase (beta-lactamase class C family)
MKNKLYLCLLPLLIFTGCSEEVDGEQATFDDNIEGIVFPGEEWAASAPEEQGMSSEKLTEVFETIDEWHPGTNSAIITRNGYIVAEMYRNGYDPEIKQWIYSATKSITTALIGIAADQGLLQKDELIVDVFKDREIQNIDESKNSIMIKDLLTMRSGFEYNEQHSYASLLEADDPVQFMLDLPMGGAPDTAFNYSGGDSHLLSAVIQEKSGMSTADYSQEYLFDPLQINNIYFSEQNGVALGANGLAMTPRDMAKIGLLYLNNGKWESEQIISEEWIEESLTPAADELFRGGTYYGYQWYIDEIMEQTVYFAQGAYGQYIYIVPELHIVGVFTSGQEAPLLNDRLFGLVGDIIDAASEEALPENEDAYIALKELVVREEVTDIISEPQLPASVEMVDGEVYLFPDNSFDWKEMALYFSNENEAEMSVKYSNGNTDEFSIGLDNLPRTGKTSSEIFTAIGVWENDSTFRIDLKHLEYLYDLTWVIDFEGNNFEKIVVTEVGVPENMITGVKK